MEIFKQYDTFKEKCSDFPDKFEKKYLSDCKLICHPLVRGELISVCSDEEAHSNALNICRMADMLLMSDDTENWSAFNLTQARSIAEQNGYIYLTDLLGENAFLSEEWMIDGKHDTVIVNEEYMREKGKKYAPVTPLTNKVLHFKKYNNGFFWKSSKPGDIICIDKDYIENRFKEFSNECDTVLPDLSESKTIDFELFGDNVSIDINTTRARSIEKFFASINDVMKVFEENNEILDIVGYKFSELDFILELTAAALRKNGIDLSKEEFASKYYSPALNGDDMSSRLAVLNGKCGNDDIDCVKLAFIDAVTAEYKDDISYSAEDSSFYANSIRQLELGDYIEDEEKYLIEEMVSHKPADYRIFYYAIKKYPDEAEHLKAFADFWQISAVPEDKMENIILEAYILDECFDEQGRFCAGYEASCILKEQLEKVIGKYGIENHEYIEELEQHIDTIDKERRTFNGTLFDTPEEMKLAVRNEAYVQELCGNLSALNEDELNDLLKQIENTTLDDDAKSKYITKVRIAMSNVQTSMLEQRCLKLSVMSLDEIADLKEKITVNDYPEPVVKPFLSKINDAYASAQRIEIEAMIENSEDLRDEQLDGIMRRVASGRYDDTIKNHYKNKIAEIKEKNTRGRLAKLVEGYESLGRDQLSELIEKLSGDSFPRFMTYGAIKKVTEVLNNFDAREAAKAFENVDFATAEQLEVMKMIIADGHFSDEILAAYIPKVEQREKDLINEELSEMCEGIDNMSQEELDKLKDDIANSDKDFDPGLVEKYMNQIVQRRVELTNSELAELCKYIFSMEQSELDDLKTKLADEKYDKEYTAVYYKKIEEREHELILLELDKLCENLEDKDTPQLEELKGEILDNSKYDGVCDRYISMINDQIDRIRLSDFVKVIDTVSEMTAEEVEDFRRIAEEKREDIGEDLYHKSMAAAAEREDIIEDEKLEKLCEGIEDYSFEKAESVKATLIEGGYTPEKISAYIDKIDDRIWELHKTELDNLVGDIGSMNKEELIQAQMKVQEYDNGCPEELKSKYISAIESAISDISDKEVRELCGNIDALSVKKSQDIIRRLNNMPLDEDTKNRYIDALDKHIASIKENEAREYTRYLSGQMDDMGVNSIHLYVPNTSNLFYAKYGEISKRYISAGRYELPLLLHDGGSSNDGFTMTTEYLYTYSRGVLNRVKIDDVASFQAKKSLMSSSLNAIERNGDTHELPNALKKDIVENVAKVLTALINFIHEKRSAEHMKEMLENAVQEKALQAAAMVAPPPVAAPAHAAEEVPVEAPAPAHAAEETPVEAYVPAHAAEETSKPAHAAEEAPAPAHAAEEAPVEAPAPAHAAEEAPAAEAPAEPKPKFCDQCGAKITNPNAKFCMECGNKLV
ncbi:MAG: hypothetical protein J1E40_08020 [Oscillospiraceae bacterium]|nr:hypothetical protein [Oscillospiraceae bacterium]